MTRQARVTVHETSTPEAGLTDNTLYPCGELQTMSHTVDVFPTTKFPVGQRALHCADDDDAEWLGGPK